MDVPITELQRVSFPALPVVLVTKTVALYKINKSDAFKDLCYNNTTKKVLLVLLYMYMYHYQSYVYTVQ